LASEGIGNNSLFSFGFCLDPVMGERRGDHMRYVQYNEKLERCYSAVIMDVMDRINFRVQCMDPAIRPLVPTMRTWGEAVTMYFEAVTEVPERPFQLEMTVLDDIRGGQVIVSQCNAVSLSAFWGGLLTNAAVGRKAAGVVTDGGIRDYNEIVGLGFPTFCKGLTPYDSLGRMDGK
jgi:4-hydroxy-4-methyl-2-oxoglutarate aldolase